uniref:NADH-ubiquinone oxidoreductase chain 4 n=1 Tax=Petroscirtes breviceps TaxID=57847 RepID=Q8HKU1_PETBE|nr:NADH dehydrogenase subunit 4 [Petroscirtes breviceps]BAC23757.1 NADH dehydrogenase subunit 4 [Petroscirtes breviceps]
MLKILLPTIMLFPTIWFAPAKKIWSLPLMSSLIIAFSSLLFFYSPEETGWMMLNSSMGSDPVSSPLIILTCWLLPLMILASQNHISPEPLNYQRTYISLLASLQLFLILAFSATELLMFYIMFEATLIPTFFIITRWGNQPERLDAGYYFLFYTLVGSLPLLLALFYIQNLTGTLSTLTLPLSDLHLDHSYAHKLLWVSCLLAFLIKTPLYGVHLWLPKAHVEAPVAGSMVLAAVLLKLGGYGMIRIILILDPLTDIMAYPFLVMALWGMIMAGSICLRQTDLKSLIAYSSVSHMGLVAAGILIQTPWGLAGSIVLMIAHGLTSSALFCLANMNYERTHSRSIILSRGLQVIFPLLSTWWFLMSLANLALPPSPNLMGELMIITATFGWSWWTLLLTGPATLITAGYSLYMFLMTQRGPLPHHITNLPPTHSREHLTVTLHLIPLVLLISKPELILGWIS